MVPDVGPLVRRVAEPGEVPARVVAAARATLAVLDTGLTHSEQDEPPGVRLQEVRGGDILRDADTVGGLLEVVRPGRVRRAVGGRGLRPDGVIIGTARVLGEPLLEVGYRHDEVDGPLALFAVDVETDGVLGVEHVADAKVGEFPAPEAGLELDGQQGAVTGIVARLDHGENLGIPLLQVTLGGDGVEAVARRRRDPREELRGLLALETVAAERPDGGRIVLVRVLVVVLLVDPPDDGVRGGAVLNPSPRIPCSSSSASMSASVSTPGARDRRSRGGHRPSARASASQSGGFAGAA